MNFINTQYRHKLIQIFLTSGVLVIFMTTSVLYGQWVQRGPSPSFNGQVSSLPIGSVTGAVNCVTPHPSDADVLYIGATNGGVWKTTDATANFPTWAFVSGSFTSQAIGALEFDPTDPSNQTLVAANGFTSSLGNTGTGNRSIFKTIDGGTSWTNIDPNNEFSGVDFRGVAPRGNTVVVAVGSTGIWRTTDNGTNWNQVSGATGSGLPIGTCLDLISDPNNNQILYAPVSRSAGNGIYKSMDMGASWFKVSNLLIDALLATASNVELAVGNTNNVFVATVAPRINNTLKADTLNGLFRSGNGGSTWASLDIPMTNEGDTLIGIHVNGGGTRFLSLAADPNNPEVVYIGGKRQPNPFPNSIGASDYTGRLFRINASLPGTMQVAPITHNGTTGNFAPHADSRDMDFDANGDLIEGDDGGVYKQTSPVNTMGQWISLIGNLNIAEAHSMDWDANFNTAIVGLQDNGITEQRNPANLAWTNATSGDGGDVLVDDQLSFMSTRYFSTQNLGGFKRRSFTSPSNIMLGSEVSVSMINMATGQTIRNTDRFPFITPLAMNSQDGQRILIATNQALYESIDQGNTVNQILTPTIRRDFGMDILAYGAADNPDIIYTSRGNNVLVKTTRPGNFAPAPGYGGQNVNGIAIDPDNSQSAFVIDQGRVFRTSNAGNTFTNITGSLNRNVVGDFQSIVYIPNAGNDMLALGTDLGVYVAEGPSFNVWSELSPTLPNVSIKELKYDEEDQMLIAGTLGRGVWTYNLTQREAVDVALVLDLSGSMADPACPGCAPKIDVLKRAAEIFLQIWKTLATANDLITTVYFRNEIDQFNIGGVNNLGVIDRTDNIIADINSQVPSAATALGGGLQTAIGELTNPTRPRHIILFSDGIQNVDPGVRFPQLDIVNDQFIPNSNVNPTAPPTDLDNLGGIRLHAIGVGIAPALLAQLFDIAAPSDGLVKITTNPDENLIRFYMEQLVEVLRDFSPQLVTYRTATAFGAAYESVDINSASKQVLFKVSYPRGTNMDIDIIHDGVDVTNRASITTGDFYKIFHYSFDQLNQINAQSSGNWGVRMTGISQHLDYQLGVLADEYEIDYGISMQGGVYEAGDPLKFYLEFERNGKPWKAKMLDVSARVHYPRIPIGNLLAEAKLVADPKIEFEKGSLIGERKLAVLQQDPDFHEKIKPGTKTIQLKQDKDGRFYGIFDQTKIAGKYDITFNIEERGKETGRFVRTEMRTAVVKLGAFDRDASKVQIKRKGERNYIVSVRPTDKFGNLLGPDHADFLNVRVSQGRLLNIKDNGDGSYVISVRAKPGSSRFTLAYNRRTWIKQILK